MYRACIACHTLSPDEGNRACPTLAGIFGRKIASLPGYNFSDALKKLDPEAAEKAGIKLSEGAEPAVAADGAGTTASRGMKSFERPRC